ncbi:hypothetical protein [Lentimicrobium saccharophilum]|uniref:hypothetical protein n=1 Tax=Lentimicrobium saccharophilum TaxID=1678841 RepID=UPI0010C790DC|nr:hypothetical protein [Lentimicrobium saccharophilum]
MANFFFPEYLGNNSKSMIRMITGFSMQYKQQWRTGGFTITNKFRAESGFCNRYYFTSSKSTSVTS